MFQYIVTISEPEVTGKLPAYASNSNVLRLLRHPDRAAIEEMKTRVGTSLFASQLEHSIFN